MLGAFVNSVCNNLDYFRYNRHQGRINEEPEIAPPQTRLITIGDAEDFVEVRMSWPTAQRRSYYFCAGCFLKSAKKRK